MFESRLGLLSCLQVEYQGMFTLLSHSGLSLGIVITSHELVMAHSARMTFSDSVRVQQSAVVGCINSGKNHCLQYLEMSFQGAASSSQQAITIGSSTPNKPAIVSLYKASSTLPLKMLLASALRPFALTWSGNRKSVPIYPAMDVSCNSPVRAATPENPS